jgi:hypothetical protein
VCVFVCVCVCVCASTKEPANHTQHTYLLHISQASSALLSSMREYEAQRTEEWARQVEGSAQVCGFYLFLPYAVYMYAWVDVPPSHNTHTPQTPQTPSNTDNTPTTHQHTHRPNSAYPSSSAPPSPLTSSASTSTPPSCACCGRSSTSSCSSCRWVCVCEREREYV